MIKILTNIATENELDWINTNYKAIGFVESSLDNELIVIATIDGQKAGLGRLVEIDGSNSELGGIYVLEGFRKKGIADKVVTALIANNPNDKHTIWCLPFDHLKSFYSKFGFEETANIKAPKEVLDKFVWCNKSYDYKVLLLSKP